MKAVAAGLTTHGMQVNDSPGKTEIIISYHGAGSVAATQSLHSQAYLFSNSLAPTIVGASLKVFEMISKDTSLRDQLEANTNYFRTEMEKAGFDLVGADAAIVPVMLYDAKLSQDMANALLEEGIYVIGFFFPVVPKEKARIRVQLSAAHTKEHLDKAINAFIKVGKQLNVI